PLRRSHKILAHLLPVHFAEQLRSLFVVPREPPNARQSVWSESDKIGYSQPPRYVLDIGIQPAVLVNYEHARQFATRIRRPRQISFNVSVAIGRIHGCAFDLDPAVVLGHLSRPSIVRGEHLPDGCSRQSTHREFLGAIEKL